MFQSHKKMTTSEEENLLEKPQLVRQRRMLPQIQHAHEEEQIPQPRRISTRVKRKPEILLNSILRSNSGDFYYAGDESNLTIEELDRLDDADYLRQQAEDYAEEREFELVDSDDSIGDFVVDDTYGSYEDYEHDTDYEDDGDVDAQ